MAVAREAETFAIPAGMSFEEAGAFPVAYISSHVAIRWQGRLEAGETLLVLGAAGGVGLTAVEIGKAMGARVIAAASTAEKLAVARERGADELVNYATEKLTERVMALTDGKGADVCFDPVGGDLFDAALSSLGWGGRILIDRLRRRDPADPGEPAPRQEPRRALGSSLRYFRWHAPDKLAQVGRRAAPAGTRPGKLRPCISHRLPLEKSVEAIRLLTDRKAYGKIVVVPTAGRLTWRSGSTGTRRHVVIVTIDNQSRLNAMSRQMMADLARLWDELERATCRCDRPHRRRRPRLQRRRGPERRPLGGAGDGAASSVTRC